LSWPASDECSRLMDIVVNPQISSLVSSQRPPDMPGRLFAQYTPMHSAVSTLAFRTSNHHRVVSTTSHLYRVLCKFPPWLFSEGPGCFQGSARFDTKWEKTNERREKGRKEAGNVSFMGSLRYHSHTHLHFCSQTQKGGLGLKTIEKSMSSLAARKADPG